MPSDLRDLTTDCLAHVLPPDWVGGADRELDRLHQVGGTVLLPTDPEWPPALRQVDDPPRALWIRGSAAAVGAPCVAIVGSRRASAYGLDVAGRFGADLAQSGLTVVSGAARGIDAAAHRGALRVGGATVAVVGSGLGVPYPPEHTGLLDAIVEAGGCVMTELPCDAEPFAHHFPRRNRILAGLCVGVVIVEAGLSSGAMITARLAADGRQREVLAVPGRVDSPGAAGCHRMIREGWATLVTSSSEVVQALGGAPGLLAACRRGPPPTSLRPELTEAVRRIQAAESGAGARLDPDQLCSVTGLKAGLVLAALSFRETWSAGDRQG